MKSKRRLVAEEEDVLSSVIRLFRSKMASTPSTSSAGKQQPMEGAHALWAEVLASATQDPHAEPTTMSKFVTIAMQGGTAFRPQAWREERFDDDEENMF